MSGDELSLGNGVDSCTSDDAEVARVLDEYLAGLEAGRSADPGRLLAEHPAIASQLRACLEVMHLAGRMVDGLGPEAADGSDSGPGSGASVMPLAPSLQSTWNLGNGTPPRVRLHDLDDDDPLVSPRSPAMPATPEGTWGRYQLQGEIARGGMGAVIKGRDVDLGRDLAIKVLLDAHRRSPETVRRFIEEAQIGGQLQHPGIVPVYELGTCADRRPYFAMKLVKGRTLSSLLQSRPDPHEDLPRFLAIFEQVGQTMAYAHARGVIHRDLKPSNIMVGSFGEVQVMDWGLAKVLARGGVADEARRAPESALKEDTVIMTVRTGGTGSGSESQAGSVLGTPAYMAPEQARGEIERLDERVDVFGLGAILCEILTGRPPFSGPTREEIRARAARGDLAEARGRLDACGADAELIALVRDCLAAEPEGRPRDAGEVARRVSAYDAGVRDRLRAAELARAEALVRAAEERKRRKVATALAASIVGLFLFGGGTWAYLARQRMERAGRIDRMAHGVELLYDEARRAGDDARRWAAAREAARSLEGLLPEAPDAGTRDRLAAVVRDVNQAAASAEGDQKLLAELADIRVVKGNNQDGSSKDAAYAAAWRSARMDLESLSPTQAGAMIAARPPAVRIALTAALDAWAFDRRVLREDEAGARRITEIARTADPDPWRDRLRTALQIGSLDEQRASLKTAASSARIDELPAVTLHLLGAGLLGAGEPAAAESLLREAVRRYPGDFWINFALARSLEALGRDEEAIRYFFAARSIQPRAAHALAHALERRGETDRAIAVFEDLTRLEPMEGQHFAWLGTLLHEHGRVQEARHVLGLAIPILRAEIERQPDRGEAHMLLGNVLAQLGKPAEAIAEYREAIRIRPADNLIHYNFGVLLGRLGKSEEAIAEYREAIRLNSSLALPHGNLGAVLSGQGKLEEAIAEYREAIRLKPDNAKAHYNLGLDLERQGEVEQAIAEFREAVRHKPDYTTARTNLGLTLLGQGKVDEAIAEFRELIRHRPDLAQAHHNLGFALYRQGKVEEAVAEFREAIRLRPGYAGTHNNLGGALSVQGKIDEAITAYREAIRLRPDIAASHHNLGNALRSRGESAEAVAELRKALDLARRTNPQLARQIERALTATEQRASLARRLPDVLAGKASPADANETLFFAQLCYQKKLYVASARFWVEAFQAQPKLIDDMQAQHRYNAACAAALAGCGQGKDDPPPDEAARARWHRQAIDWLKSDLAAWTKILDTGPPQARPVIAQTLDHWKADADLAGLRDPAAVGKLAEAEQKACRALWAEVDALLKKARDARP